MDSDFEGSAGSDLDDLINIDCDLDDDELDNLDTSFLLSDDNSASVTANKSIDNKTVTTSDASKSESAPTSQDDSKATTPTSQDDNKTATPTSKDDGKNTTPTSKDDGKNKEKKEINLSKSSITKSGDCQVTEKPAPAVTQSKENQSTVKKINNKPALKTPEKEKTRQKEKILEKEKPVEKEEIITITIDDDIPSTENSTENKKLVTKMDEKNSAAKATDEKKMSQSASSHTKAKRSPKPSASKKETTAPNKDDLVVIDDDEDEDADNISVEGSIGLMEGDVDEFPEEWMVIDEMDDTNVTDTKSRSSRDSKSTRSRTSDYSRTKSRRRSRSRSRSRGRSRGSSRRSRASDRESDRERSSQDKRKSIERKDNKPSVSNKPATKELEKKDVKAEDKTTTKDGAVTAKKPEVPLKPIDPFKNMRDTIEKFDKNWRWNLKLSPIEMVDLKNDVFRKIISLANDSVLVFNMQKDKKRKYGFLDLCLSSAGEIRQAIDLLCSLKLETNFIHVSVSHKLFENKGGTESALLKLDLREGVYITSNPVKGTEKQRKINISNGPKEMSKILLDAIFPKVANIVITENKQNETCNATVLCSNPHSVGGVLRCYQSVVISGRRLQIRSEVNPPPKPKDPPKEERKSPAINNSNQKSSNKNKRQSDNRRQHGGPQRNNGDGLLGPVPNNFEMTNEQRQNAHMAREEAERRRESMQRLGITVGVENFMEMPNLLNAPDVLRQETERMQRELENSQHMYRMEGEMRLREVEMRHQAELREHQQKQEELLIQIQQERQQQMQEKQRMEQERIERDRIERFERERFEREKMEIDRMEKVRKERERIEIERKEKERQQREHQERERQERERKQLEQRLERERKDREEKERLLREQLEKERNQTLRRQAELKQKEDLRRQEEIRRQEEVRRQDRGIKREMRDDQQRQLYSTNTPWQHSVHLQNEQELFEKEIGLNSMRNRPGRFEADGGEEKKLLHQQIREQWEKQVQDARFKQAGQVQQEMGRPRSSRFEPSIGDTNQEEKPQVGGNSMWNNGRWETPTGNNWPNVQRGQGLLGAVPTTVSEYGHQPLKRGNPWNEENTNFGEKRSRGQVTEYGNEYQQREQQQQHREPAYGERDQPASLLGRRPQTSDQWKSQEERNFNQAANWGAGAETYRKQYSSW